MRKSNRNEFWDYGLLFLSLPNGTVVSFPQMRVLLLNDIAREHWEERDYKIMGAPQENIGGR